MTTNTNVITKDTNQALDFANSITKNRRDQIGNLLTIKEFLSAVTGELTLDERKIIVEQALTLFEKLYVHLPLKKAMHAVDPIQRLRLLQVRLGETIPDQMISELEFHKEMMDIFTSVRDLHTNYLLPQPFAGQVAFLPFLIESYIENNKRKFMITKVAKGYEDALPPTFKPGSRYNLLERDTDRTRGPN